jgi:hypothetical protein
MPAERSAGHARDEESVWAVGRFHRDGATVLWPSTRAERSSAAAFAARTLRLLGIGAGARVVLVSMMSDGVQVVPFEDALRRLHAVMTPADATVGDAGRVASVLSTARPRAVIGITESTLDGLAPLGHGPEIFEAVPVLAATPPAAARLEAAGLSPLRWLTVGPVMAVECLRRAGAHLDGGTWRVAVEHGEVVLHPRLPNHALGSSGIPEAVPTGIDARVVADRCGCGSDDPRLILG